MLLFLSHVLYKDVYDEISDIATELLAAQGLANVEFPIHLSKESGGLVESWVRGATWRELCTDTSLDQGDLCRLLRRTVITHSLIHSFVCNAFMIYFEFLRYWNYFNTHLHFLGGNVSSNTLSIRDIRRSSAVGV